MNDSAAPPMEEPIPKLNLHAPPYSEEVATERRTMFLTKKHTIAEKMELYNCSTKGNIDEFKKLIVEKNYSPTEEVSKEGHFWTVFHYASHYGHINVLRFLIEHLEEND